MAKKWIQAATKKMEQKGTKGSFSKAAKKAGKSTSAFATSVLANPSASPKMKKKAQFAKNVMGGSTPLAPSHPKAKAMVEGRKSNMQTKCDFCG